MDEEILYYSTKQEQIELLQQVLAASDADAEEEDARDEFGEGGKSDGKVSFREISPFGYETVRIFFQFIRREGSMSSLSGVHNVVYAQTERKKAASSAERHPLFKRFRTK